jgi:hypothetical protein
MWTDGSRCMRWLLAAQAALALQLRAKTGVAREQLLQDAGLCVTDSWRANLTRVSRDVATIA